MQSGRAEKVPPGVEPEASPSQRLEPALEPGEASGLMDFNLRSLLPKQSELKIRNIFHFMDIKSL